MTLIQINPDEVRDTGMKFSNMHNDVNQLVAQARTMMSTLEGNFKGKRAGQIFGEWEQMLPSLNSAAESLEAAGRLLSSAAEDFSAADLR